MAHVPFVLAPGLFYGCAFETAAGAIEVEAVGGHNAASLAAQYLRSAASPEGDTGITPYEDKV